MSDYSFGDSERAAERLALLARNFEPASRDFLASAAPKSCARALDLGCGTGLTTRLLHEVCAPRELLGLDASPSFVERARRDAPSGVAFAVHDVTRLPFPGGAADLIYGRLLLSHLPEPERVLARWRAALRPGGRLLCEEVEWIRTEDPAFRRYLELVAEMLRGRGQQLYVGARVEVATRGAGRPVCALREVRLPPDLAAGMFSPNLAELRRQQALREQAGEAALDELAAALRERLEGRAGADVCWGLRQVAVEV